MAKRWARLVEGVRKARVELKLARRSFHEFVSDDRVTELGQTIPVFCFHAVNASEFEGFLRHLQRNDYRTLGADHLVECLRGERSVDNAVALTFDDGWLSTWSVAYPLMKQYGFRGISFLVPTWTGEDEPGPTLDDVRAGRLALEDLARLERDRPYLSWSEAKTMQSGGVFEFQSHSLTHDTVFTSETIVDFVNPTFRRVPHKIPIVDGVSTDPWQRASALGMPLYTVAPRMTGATRYIDCNALRETCIEFVRRKGGERFFEAADWRAQLERLVKGRSEGERRFDTPEERDEAIRRELRESKTRIEARLERPVRHLCFPFYSGSALASEISRELGYTGNFWGWKPASDRDAERYGTRHSYAALDETDYAACDQLRGRRCNRVGDDPFRIVRLPGDYIHRLPGRGRQSLAAIFARKCRRALAGGGA